MLCRRIEVMNNRQISALLNSRPFTANVFRGVFPRDANVQPLAGAYIWNTDRSNRPGAHWVVTIVKRDGNNEYFDSYGLPPLFSELERFLGDSYSYNSECFQQLFSSVCGHYCIYYITQYARGYSQVAILNMLSKKHRPDVYVALFVKNTFNIDLGRHDIPYTRKQICRMRYRNI